MHGGRTRDDIGQSLVEFSLALPILVFGLIGGADLARAFAIQLAVQNAARAGAEAAAIDFSPTPGLATSRAFDELSRTPGLDPAQATIQVRFKQADGITNCPPGVTPTVASPCFATVRVQYAFRTTIAWPAMPNVANFDRETTVRMIAAP